MPAKSKKQERYMQGCINNPKRMKGKCPSKKDAKRVLGKHGKNHKRRKH